MIATSVPSMTTAYFGILAEAVLAADLARKVVILPVLQSRQQVTLARPLRETINTSHRGDTPPSRITFEFRE